MARKITSTLNKNTGSTHFFLNGIRVAVAHYSHKRDYDPVRGKWDKRLDWRVWWLGGKGEHFDVAGLTVDKIQKAWRKRFRNHEALRLDGKATLAAAREFIKTMPSEWVKKSA